MTAEQDLFLALRELPLARCECQRILAERRVSDLLVEFSRSMSPEEFRDVCEMAESRAGTRMQRPGRSLR